MLREKPKQMSLLGSLLYRRIPAGHILVQIDEAVDFSFLNEKLAHHYCKSLGRPAKEPEMMMKLLFLQYLYNLSDVKVIEEANVNIAFMFYLGINPEDALPDPSLLAKFRTKRLHDSSLDDILTEIARQCVERGIIKSESVNIDATHIAANCGKLVPERVMKKLAKKIFKAVETDNGAMPETVNTEIPDYKQIADHEQAKAAMKECVERVIEDATPFAGEETQEAIEEARGILSDEKFILQKGVRSLTDRDARVGYKTKTDSFFGYKGEIVMTAEERIITAVHVASGEYVDGTEFAPLMDLTLASGMRIREVFGDKGYFRPNILEKIKWMQAKGYIPVSASVYRIDEELFSYNKDSDQWVCAMGNRTESKATVTKKQHGEEKQVLQYKFEKAQCAGCAHRAECMGKCKAKARTLVISVNTPEFYEISQSQKSEEFLEAYKKRSSIEWKNAELKRFHGLDVARGWGRAGVTVQTKLTAIAVNLKRIASIIRSEKRKSETPPTAVEFAPAGA
jgi:radical SAM protein with 4Fe4S-binding SPASM domain